MVDTWLDFGTFDLKAIESTILEGPVAGVLCYHHMTIMDHVPFNQSFC